MALKSLKSLVLAGASVLALLPGPARAGEQNMSYEVYAGGIHALEGHLKIKTDKGRYDIILDAKTRGFLGKMAPWEGIFESHGWIEKGGVFKPETHKSTAIWRGEQEIKEYKYKRNGAFVGLTETLAGKPPEEKSTVTKELTEGTTDALTATLNVLEKVAQGKECQGDEQVFDGLRRFKQIFTDTGVEELTPTKYNIFKGPAVSCTVEVEPIAGKWYKKPRGWMSIQEQGRLRGSLPTLWAATLKEGNPAVPVKVRVSTSYGVLFMHLTSFKDEKKSIVADQGE